MCNIGKSKLRVPQLMQQSQNFADPAFFIYNMCFRHITQTHPLAVKNITVAVQGRPKIGVRSICRHRCNRRYSISAIVRAL